MLLELFGVISTPVMILLLCKADKLSPASEAFAVTLAKAMLVSDSGMRAWEEVPVAAELTQD